MATRAASGLSQRSHTTDAIREAVDVALERLDESQVDFALVFAGSDHSARYSDLLEAAVDRLGTSTLAGCSAGGLLTDDGEIESPDAVAVLAVCSDDFSASLLPCPAEDGLQESIRESVMTRLGREDRGSQRPAAVLAFLDPYSTNPYAVAGDLERLFPDTPIIGGGASAGPEAERTWIFSGSRVFRGTQVLALFGQSPSVGATALGAGPVGPTWKVTQCNGPDILELDGRSASGIFMDLFRKAFEENWSEALQSVYLAISPDSSGGEFHPERCVIRNLIGFRHPQGVLRVAYPFLRDGMAVRFAVRDAEMARQQVQRMLEHGAGRLPNAAMGVYFNCAGRGAGLYDGQEGVDLGQIREAFPHLPLIGLFSSFELGPMGDRTVVHNYSGVLWLGGRLAHN